jgi:hypothetical protein
MKTIYTFKQTYKGFSQYEDEYIALAAIKYVVSKNINIGQTKIMFLGSQAIDVISQCGTISDFKNYMGKLNVSRHAYV